MNIHEYQAKEILAKFSLPVSQGRMGFSAEEIKKGAEELASKYGAKLFVVKAQIHAGGRGKAGGVKVVKTVEEAYEAAKKMLGMTLVTPQTGPAGKVVKRLYVENGNDIEKEFYLSFLVDRDTSRVTIVASEEGGVEIEEVAEKHPERIIKVSIGTATGIQPFHSRKLITGLRITDEAQKKKFAACIQGLYKAFVATDASQIEINPFVRTPAGDFVILDAKINFDDNALFRHPDIVEMRDTNEEEPLEIRAADAGLSYIKMDGNIGCLVNGAGLAMATMDIIKLHGGEPANFLDVGGGATKERVTEAFRIILSDSNVKGILVNIFGGIMRCDIIAEGVIAAAKEIGLKVPLVVRLAGTNVELGKQILSQSGLNILSASDLGDAAQKIVNAVKKEAA